MPTEDYENFSDCDCERCDGTGSYTWTEDDEPYLGDDRIFSGYWDEYEAEPDYGGAFDGRTVTSDADSGL